MPDYTGLHLATSALLTIVYVVRRYHPDGSNADLPRRKQSNEEPCGCPGTAGARIVDGLGPHGEVTPDAERLMSVGPPGPA